MRRLGGAPEVGWPKLTKIPSLFLPELRGLWKYSWGTWTLNNSCPWCWAHKGCFNAIPCNPTPSTPTLHSLGLEWHPMSGFPSLRWMKHSIVCLEKWELKLAPCDKFSWITDFPGANRRNVENIKYNHRQRMGTENGVTVAWLTGGAKLAMTLPLHLDWEIRF